MFAVVLATACARPQDFEYDTDLDGNFDAEVIQELAARDLYDVSSIHDVIVNQAISIRVSQNSQKVENRVGRGFS